MELFKYITCCKLDLALVILVVLCGKANRLLFMAENASVLRQATQVHGCRYFTSLFLMPRNIHPMSTQRRASTLASSVSRVCVDYL
jgi:hypothetical protein